jgi:hypothetical protein
VQYDAERGIALSTHPSLRADNALAICNSTRRSAPILPLLLLAFYRCAAGELMFGVENRLLCSSFTIPFVWNDES